MIKRYAQMTTLTKEGVVKTKVVESSNGKYVKWEDVKEMVKELVDQIVDLEVEIRERSV